MTSIDRRFAKRVFRNLVVAIAVTAIFGFKAADLETPAPNPLTLAAR